VRFYLLGGCLDTEKGTQERKKETIDCQFLRKEFHNTKKPERKQSEVGQTRGLQTEGAGEREWFLRRRGLVARAAAWAGSGRVKPLERGSHEKKKRGAEGDEGVVWSERKARQEMTQEKEEIRRRVKKLLRLNESRSHDEAVLTAGPGKAW